MREYLKTLHSETGISQLEVSQKLDVSESYYSLILSGERQKELDLSLALKLAKCFDVSIDFIIDEEEKLKRRVG